MTINNKNMCHSFTIQKKDHSLYNRPYNIFSKRQFVRVFNIQEDYKKGANLSLHYTENVHFISIENGELSLTHSSNPLH